MRKPIDSFKLNIKSVRELQTLYTCFERSLPALDLSEILRAEYVLVVSALDCYFHDIVIINMRKFFKNDTLYEQLPNGFQSYMVQLGAIYKIMKADTNDEKEAIIHKALKETLYKFSFESERSIDSAMSYIGVKKIWSKIGDAMGHIPTDDLKRKLAFIVKRRNNIAHQSDISNFSTMEKDPIASEDVESIIEFISNFVEAADIEINTQLTH